MESKKIYFDTNIVLDIIDDTRVDHKNANALLEFCILNKHEINISEDMLSTIFYINKNKKKTLLFLKVAQKRWQIVPFGKDVILNAIDLALEKNLDLEDVLQCVCAKENRCKYLITNDKKFYDCGLSRFTTEEFLKEKNVQK